MNVSNVITSREPNSIQLSLLFPHLSFMSFLLFFFFQAEDGIRDLTVTGVQTCALPISEQSVDGTKPLAGPQPAMNALPIVSLGRDYRIGPNDLLDVEVFEMENLKRTEIGRASCRERV